jgi:hypothetical protein
MSLLAYARGQAAAAARLMRFDGTALAALDQGPAAARLSFLAALVLVPGIFILVVLQDLGEGTDIALPSVLALGLAYIVAWLFYLVVMERLCAWMDFGPRFPLFVTAYNWAMVVQVLLFVPIVAVATLLLPGDSGTPFILIANLALLVAQGFVTQSSLQASPFTAVAFVALDVLTGIVVNTIAAGLFGGGA